MTRESLARESLERFLIFCVKNAALIRSKIHPAKRPCYFLRGPLARGAVTHLF